MLKKVLIINLMGILGLFLVFLVTWQTGTKEQLKIMYPLNASENKEASKEFLKAMEYRIYITQLHPYFDYDSLITKPFLTMMDYHLEKGKKLLPKDSVEDIFWWVLLYKEIYAIIPPPRNDNSLAYYKLKPIEFKKFHNKIYNKIEKYAKGNIYFDLKEIKQHKFKTMVLLIDAYYKRFMYRYNANTREEQKKLQAYDPNAIVLLNNIIDYYKESYNKHIQNSSDKSFMIKEYKSDMIYLITKSIAIHTFVNNSHKLSPKICKSENTRFLLDNIDELTTYVENNDDRVSKEIFDELFKKPSNVPQVFTLLLWYCKPLDAKLVKSIEKIDNIKNK